MVESVPNTLAPSALIKVRPGHPKKKVVVTSRLPQKSIVQFFSK
jgi:hypothetical protein